MKKGLIALALGTLGLGMSEFVMMGILPDVARDLDISIPVAGHFISAYAIGVCVGAPLLVLVARKRPLKQILLALVAIFALGNLLSCMAPNYHALLATRFLSGLPHGAYFGVGSIVASKMAAEGKSSAAVAMMIAGMTVANLAGVPLGTYISQTISWRTTFLLISCLDALILYFVWCWVPYFDPLPDTGFKGQFRFLRSAAPWLLILATMLGNGGLFCWYSYISPLMTSVSGFAPDKMTDIMVLAGLGMCIGNILSGRLSDIYSPARVATTVQLLMGFSLLLIFLLAQHAVLSVILMTICTAGLFALSAPQQILLLRNSKGGEMLGAASVQVAFNLGNALGAYSGGLPIEAGLGYRYPALVGVGFCFIGFLMLLIYWKRYDKKVRPLKI